MGRSVYFYIPLLALYGDIIKRFYPSGALATVYGLAILILLSIVYQSKGKRVSLGREAKQIIFIVSLLIATYALQVSTSFNSPLNEGLSHFLYMAVPLSFIIVILKYLPQFELTRLAMFFLIMMIPINIAGFMQYWVDPSFMISTGYSGDLGGVIERNLIYKGVFNRYPALFVSADRYSAMALMQFVFSIMVLSGKGAASYKRYLWFIVNLLSSFAALGISGARSRIFIALTISSFIAVVQLVALIRVSGISIDRRIKGLVALTLSLCLIILFFTETHAPNREDIPILTMIQQTFAERDIHSRIDQSLTLSFIPDDISLFGAGLGTESQVPGKPGEFGIRAIWAESGFFWGSLILFCFLGIVYLLFIYSFKAAVKGESLSFVMHSTPLLLIIFGLLSGFTGVFELSSGILLACVIAKAVQPSSENTFLHGQMMLHQTPLPSVGFDRHSRKPITIRK